MIKKLTVTILLLASLAIHASITQADTASITQNDDAHTRTMGLLFTMINSGTAYEVSRGNATATDIVIPATYNNLPVTSIAEEGFAYLTNLTSITIPESVTSIGEGAFYGTSLTSINIPSGVTSINDWVFQSCENLVSVTLPTGITSIGDYAFEECYNLQNINFPEGLISIGEGAFGYCESLSTLIFPSSLSSIAEEVFYGCPLETIEVASANTTFRSEGNCLISMQNNTLVLGSSTSVIPSSVVSIGSVAFSSRKNLTSINIPSTVQSIGNYAFDMCENLSSVTLASGLQSIGEQAFSFCYRLQSINIPLTVTTIGAWAFGNCESLVIYTAHASKPSGWANNWNSDGRPVVWGYTGGTGELSFTPLQGIDGYKVSRGTFNGANVVIPTNYGPDNWLVMEIEAEGFANFTNMTSISIPNSVIAIGMGAFYGCENLASITLPDGLEEIPGGAFAGCSSLTSITIPANVESIYPSAFADCTSLTTITFLEGLETICSEAFTGCTSLTSIALPASLTGVYASSFRFCSALSSITVANNNTNFIGDGNCLISIENDGSENVYYLILACQTSEIPTYVTQIDYEAFAFNTSFTTITIPNGVEYIHEDAFTECINLTSIIIPSSVTNIGSNAFSGCISLSSIIIPEGVDTIGSFAFAYCTSLTTISLPASLGTIGTMVFMECNSLVNMTIAPENLIWRSEGNCLIQRNNNSVILGCMGSVIPASTPSIRAGAFSQLTNLSAMYIPASVTIIESYAFPYSPNLVLFAEPATEPAGWVDGWNSDCPVVWGATMNPVAPTALNGTIDGYAVNLRWTPPANVYIPNFMSYAVYRGEEMLVNTGVTNPNFTDTNPPAGDNIYTVKAIYLNGTSPATSSVTVTEPENPVPPVALSAEVEQYSVVLTWQAGTRAVLGYKVFQGTDIVTEDMINDLTYTHQNVTPGVYTYGVQAIYTGNVSSSMATVTGVRVYALSPATALQATPTNTPSIALSWTAPVAEEHLSFKVYRKVGTADFTMIHQTADATTLTYDDTDVVVATTYQYYVTAVYPTGESVPTDTVSAVFYNLLPPTNLQATVTETPSISLSWTAPEAAGVTNYKVYRKAGTADEFTMTHQTADATVLSWIDTTAIAGTTYLYYVVTTYPTGDSLPTSTVSAIFYNLLPPTGLVATGSTETDTPSVSLVWVAPEAVGVTHYKVYRKIGAEEFASIHQTTDALTVTYTDSQVTADTPYQYYVTAVYPTGESVPSATASATPTSESDVVSVTVTSLIGNYPNPFNPSTTIAFDMAREGHVTIEIYNSKGQRVKEVVSGSFNAGSHRVVWNGQDESGRAVSSGVYFYRMITSEYSSMRKMLLIK